MKRALMTLFLPFALAACGTAATNYGGGSAPSSPSGSATVSVADSSLGQILVDGNGKTLYLFEADTSTQSTCSGGCAQAWPPVTTNGAPKAAGGASASLLGTTARSDGTASAYALAGSSEMARKLGPISLCNMTSRDRCGEPSCGRR